MDVFSLNKGGIKMIENKFEATNQRDAVIKKILKMKLTSADLEWLAEGIIEIANEMIDEKINYSDEVKI